MGLYCSIYIKAAPSVIIEDLPDDARILATAPSDAEHECPGATHEVETCRGYYSPNYRRGYWPSIHAILAYLLAHPQVSTVWYGSDAGEPPEPMTAEKLLRYTADYAWYSRDRFIGVFGAGKSAAVLHAAGFGWVLDYVD